MTNANLYGVEPADEMRQKAIDKNAGVIFEKGNHEKIPFIDNFFDFIYMTDVIHHIPDIPEITESAVSNGFIFIKTGEHNDVS